MFLHGVKLDLYSRTDNSVEHVYGKEFEYNITAGTIKALGDVEMDIETPASVGGHLRILVREVARAARHRRST